MKIPERFAGKSVNKKSLLGGLVLLVILAIIAISSFVPFAIDPKRWQTVDFLTKEIIVIVITIAGIITSMFIGQSQNADNPRSEIARAKVRFSESIVRIKDRSAFKQWVHNVLEPSDKEIKRERLMAKHGIEQKEVFDLDRSEVRQLIETPQKFGDKYYRSISKDQADFILEYKEGKYAIDYVNPEYYLTVSSINNDKTISEKAGKETRTKTALLTTQMISKIVRGLIFAMVFASLVFDTQQAADAAGIGMTPEEAAIAAQAARMTAWMTFGSRILALVTASFSGYIIGSKTNDVEADYINMRCSVHDEFLSDTKFVAKTDQQLAKEEFAERVHKEETESIMKIEMKGE